jgi:hypothetical protein
MEVPPATAARGAGRFAFTSHRAGGRGAHRIASTWPQPRRISVRGAAVVLAAARGGRGRERMATILAPPSTAS